MANRTTPEEDEYFRKNEFNEGKEHFLGKMSGLMPSQFLAKPDAQLTSDYLYSFKAWCRFSRLLGQCQEPSFEIDILIEKCKASLNKHFVEEYADILHQYADVNYYRGKYDEAIENVNTAIHIRAGRRLSQLSIGRYHLVAGKTVWKKGDIYHALTHFADAYKTIHETDSESYLLGRVAFHLGQVFLQLEDFDLAKQLLRSSLKIYKNSTLSPDHIYVSASESVLAKCLLNSIPRGLSLDEADPENSAKGVKAKLKEAKKLLKHARKILKSINFVDHRNYASIKANFATAYSKQYTLDKDLGHIEHAIQTYKKELKIREAAFGGAYHPTIAYAYGRLCERYLKLRHFDAAFNAAELAIEHAYNAKFVLDQVWTDPESSGIKANPVLLQSLYLGALAHYKCYTQVLQSSDKLLIESNKLIDLAIEVYKQIRNQTTTVEQGKLILGNDIRKVNELAIKILFERKRIAIKKKQPNQVRAFNEKIFEMFQRSKAITLLESIIQRNDHSSFSRAVKVTLNDIKDYFYEKIVKKSNARNIDFKPDILNRLKGLILANNHEIPILKLDELWSKFKDDSRPGVILSYLVCPDAVFVMSIGSKEGDFNCIKLEFSGWNDVVVMKECIHNLITELNESIKEKSFELEIFDVPNHHGQLNNKIYRKISLLYKKLIQPLKLDFKSIQRLYIIPDDNLAYLPFEILAPQHHSKPPKSLRLNNLKYIIKKCTVSYHTSIPILYRNHCTEDPIRHNVVEALFSMGVPGRLDENSLFKTEDDIHFEESIKGVYELLKTQWPQLKHNHLDWSATNFESIKEGFQHAQIAHLFVHSVYESNKSGDQPAIILASQTLENYDETLLKLNQIEALEITKNFQVLFLIACQSGRGPLDPMEGPLSLARSFMQTGIRNIYYTLFKISSSLGNKLVQRIVEELLVDGNYSAALQRVKLQLIAENVHPCLWAAPVFIGGQSEDSNLIIGH